MSLLENQDATAGAVTKVTVSLNGELDFGSSPFKIALEAVVAGGPLEIGLVSQSPIALTDLYEWVRQLLEQIGLDLPEPAAPWSMILDRNVNAAIWLRPGAETRAAYLQLDLSPPLPIGGSRDFHGVTITLEPDITVESIYLGYDAASGKGVDFRIKVSSPTTGATKSGAGLLTAGGESLVAKDPPTKTQVVSYPFPVPSQKSASKFKLKYLGLGQRVGPDPQVNPNGDPLATIFDQLESDLATNDPKAILEQVAANFYKPDRDWFIAADIEFRGFELRILFNDPAMYGLEITAGAGTGLEGLLFEILYQKLGPHLGVYYGALTLPDVLRRIPIDGAILILPSFSVWIYTNGDFRINIGWPLGPNSIGLQLDVLLGRAGLYFAKLRSGDNPGHSPSESSPGYNPILEFGLAVSLSAEASLNASVLSASISVDFTATFQGLLAWGAAPALKPPQRPPPQGGAITKTPGHYWFAATATLVVSLKGEVNFRIIKVTVAINFTASVGVALETGHAGLVQIAAEVTVSASIKIIFFTIHFSFHASVTHTFTIGSGPPASTKGPLGMGSAGALYRAFEDKVLEDVALHRESLSEGQESFFELTPLQSPPIPVTAFFILQPAVVFDQTGVGQLAAVASLVTEAPVARAVGVASPDTMTQYEQLIRKYVEWLYCEFTPAGGATLARLRALAGALGSGKASPSTPVFGGFAGFREHLFAFFNAYISLEIRSSSKHEADLPPDVAVLPMFDELQLRRQKADGTVQVIRFSEYEKTPANYPLAIDLYYDLLTETQTWAEMGYSTAETISQPSPTVASFLSEDYFLMVARQAVNQLVDLADKSGAILEKQLFSDLRGTDADRRRELIHAHVMRTSGDNTLLELLDELDYGSIAGLGSRSLLQGVQLPIPKDVPKNPTPENMPGVPTAGMSVLTGQQWLVRTGATDVTAALMANSNDPGRADWIHFDGSLGTADAELALPAAAPSIPAPSWSGPQSSPADVDVLYRGPESEGIDGDIEVGAINTLTAFPLYVAQTNRTLWTAESARTLLPLNADLGMWPSGSGAVEVSNVAPDEEANPPLLEGAAVLTIALSINQIGTIHDTDVGATSPPPDAGTTLGSPPVFGPDMALPFVFSINGADETTRDLIEDALQSADFNSVRISIAYADPSSNQICSEELSPDVMLLKTNLSTLNQAYEVSALCGERMQVLGALQGDDVATIDEAEAFLRLLWECSVVHASGYYLYYRTSDGHPLAPDVFTDGKASITIIVEPTTPSQNLIQVASYQNSVCVLGNHSADTLYMDMYETGGGRVMRYGPTYPAGNFGVALEWTHPAEASPPPMVPVAELYHLIQYAIEKTGGYGGSVWSLPLTPNDAPTDGGLVVSNYQVIVPVDRFLTGSTNRYQVNGRPVDIKFRLADMFGNIILHDSPFTFTPYYHDPLVPPDEWPSFVMKYRVMPGGLGEAMIALHCDFQINGIEHNKDPKSMLAAADSRYALIYDQLTDPNVSMTAFTTLVPLADGPLQGSHYLHQTLIDVVSTIRNRLRDAIDSNKFVPYQRNIDISVPISAVGQLPQDIFPIGVTVGMERLEGVPPHVLENLPSAGSVQCSIRPDLDALRDAVSPGTQESGIHIFANDFESAYFGFDGRQGELIVAQRPAAQKSAGSPSDARGGGMVLGHAPAEDHDLWAVRWSDTAGISVRFGGAPIDDFAYFAVRPISTKLQNHVFNGTTLHTGVDVDQWAREFLDAVDTFLAPEYAVGMAVLDSMNQTDYLEAILGSKRQLASIIPNGLVNIFEEGARGDIGGAREVLEQSLLKELGSAYSISTVVQARSEVTTFPASLSSPNGFPPSFYGGIVSSDSLQSDSGVPPKISKRYTLSGARLQIEDGYQWAAFMVGTADPALQTELVLPLNYAISYLQHDFLPDEEYQGFVPSSWLKFVLTRESLDLPVTASNPAEIPIPLRADPQAPACVKQTAQGVPITPKKTPSPPGPEITAALDWEYQADIRVKWDLHDELLMTAIYNLPRLDSPPRVHGEPPDANLAELVTALGEFREAVPAIKSQFPEIMKKAYGSGGTQAAGAEVVKQLANLVEAVTAKWPTYAEGDLTEMNPPVSDIIEDEYVVKVDRADMTVMYVCAGKDDQETPPWPTEIVANQLVGKRVTVGRRSIALSAAAPTASSQAVYRFPPGTTFEDYHHMMFCWAPLSVLSRQTVTLEASILRNSELVPNRQTNPDFIYRSQVGSFPAPTVPMINRATLGPLTPDSGGLKKTLEEILKPIVTLAKGGGNPIVRLGAGYSFLTNQVAGKPTKPGMRISSPVILADSIELNLANGNPEEDIAAAFAHDLSIWYNGMEGIQNDGGLLNLNISLFGTIGDNLLPIVQLANVPVVVSLVPPSWWNK